MQSFNNKLYAIGDFENIANVSNTLTSAQWDGSKWSPWTTNRISPNNYNRVTDLNIVNGILYMDLDKGFPRYLSRIIQGFENGDSTKFEALEIYPNPASNEITVVGAEYLHC